MRLNHKLGVFLAAPFVLLTISATNVHADSVQNNSNNAQQVISNVETQDKSQPATSGSDVNNQPVASANSSASAKAGNPTGQVSNQAAAFSQATETTNFNVQNSAVNPAELMTAAYVTNYTQQQINNASYINSYFTSRGWTAQSVAGMLGNMVSESGLQPNLWEYGGGGGYGLVQWTPATSMMSWCRNNGHDYTSLEGQCAYIQYQMTHGLQFYPSRYSGMTAYQYMHSTLSPYSLALIFLANFERPANPNQPSRGQQAQYWYQYFQSHGGSTTAPTQQPTTPTTPTSQMNQHGTFRVAYGLNVRQAPSTSSAIVATYSGGQSFPYDSKVEANGYLWVSYIGGSGIRRYVAIKNLSNGITYGYDSNNFSYSAPSTTPTTPTTNVPSKPTTPTSTTINQRGTFKTAYGLNVRQAPSTSSAVVSAYSAGQSFPYDSKVKANGYLWVSYVSYSGVRHYVAIKNLSDGSTYGYDSNNFSYSTPSTTPTTPTTNVPSKPTAPTSSTVNQRGTFKVAYGLNVRQAPSTSAAIVSYYSGGQSFSYDSKVEANGYLWVSYLSYSGVRHYVAIKNLSNGTIYGYDSNNFSFNGTPAATTSNTSSSSNVSQESKAQQVVAIARQQIGKPYVWGAAGPNSFDCSGLVQYVYRQVGVNLPRTATQQEYSGYSVSFNNLQPGDLMFWGNYGSAYHVGIYTGNGNVLFAPQPGQTVKEQPMTYYMPSFARRVL